MLNFFKKGTKNVFARSRRARPIPFFVLIIFLGSFAFAGAANISLSPASGTFTVGSTFDVAILLNTENELINAIDVALQFPPEKIQLVSPSTGQSIIGVWTAQPEFNNRTGRLSLQGVIPNGINVSNGLVGRFTFRINGTGSAVFRFLDQTRVLLNDGKGTDALKETTNGIYNLVLPPPAGPIVASETHPDQSRWYPLSSAVLRWDGGTGIGGYSYMLSDQPVDIPDDTSEGVRNGLVYKTLANGTHYFHIKALRSGAWGGTTHFAINVDTEKPAEFQTEILPSARTDRRNPILQFFTTDAHSGVDYYELKLIPLTAPTEMLPDNHIGDNGEGLLFIEVTSPYVFQTLELGSYDVLIRAYDKAGNYRESVARLKIVIPFFRFIGIDGIRIADAFTIPWLWVIIIILILIAIFGIAAWRLKKWHDRVDVKRLKKELPQHVQENLEKLKEYQKRYGNIASALLILGGLWIAGTPVFAQLEERYTVENDQTFVQAVEQQDSFGNGAGRVEVSPPAVNLVSRNVTNEEIFYIGGKTELGGAEVIIYLQNLQTGETFTKVVNSDNRGDWFYRHDTFLTSGSYLLWTQSRLGRQVSPPSPQIQMTVEPTAIQFGASRISFEFLYLGFTIVLFLVLLLLGGYTVYHGMHARRKHGLLLREIQEAEESLRRGFAVLRRDIKAELALVNKAKMSRELSEEEKKSEAELLSDLDIIEKQVGKEIWDIEEVERGDPHAHKHEHEEHRQ